ncbi:MAG: EndoU domain-containing protein [Nitrosomonas sp.]|nr:EndoU domain-containing protein [Nitrosomonas sp.]MDP1950592.1 EndoU domain-containing protein [Nitrosomonas sp.]
MIIIKTGSVILTGLLALCLWPLSALAQVNCATLPHWVKLNNGLQMNQIHVFCGEWQHDRAKGFHSRPDGINPATVAKFTVQDRPNAAGIYTGKWSYQNQPDKNKFSSLFPDNCSTEQVLNSISHASTTTDAQCPQGAPSWTKCGQNKPKSAQKNSIKYCSKDGQFFTIGFAPPQNGKINTAFPIFQ